MTDSFGTFLKTLHEHEAQKEVAAELYEAAEDILNVFRYFEAAADHEEREAALQRLSLAVSACEELGWHELAHQREEEG